MIKITKQRKKGELIDDIGEQTTGYSMVAKLVDHIKKTFKNPLVKLTMEKLNITEGEFLEGLLRNFKELSDDRKISFLAQLEAASTVEPSNNCKDDITGLTDAQKAVLSDLQYLIDDGTFNNEMKEMLIKQFKNQNDKPKWPKGKVINETDMKNVDLKSNQIKVAQYISDEFMDGWKVSHVLFEKKLECIIVFKDKSYRIVTGKFASDIKHGKY